MPDIVSASWKIDPLYCILLRCSWYGCCRNLSKFQGLSSNAHHFSCSFPLELFFFLLKWIFSLVFETLKAIIPEKSSFLVISMSQPTVQCYDNALITSLYIIAYSENNLRTMSRCSSHMQIWNFTKKLPFTKNNFLTSFLE